MEPHYVTVDGHEVYCNTVRVARLLTVVDGMRDDFTNADILGLIRLAVSE